MLRFLFLLLFVATIAIATEAQRMSREQYINTYKKLAINEMNTNGIPASITLAQGILESDCGNSYLATEGNNHFGIKCHGWQGDTIFHDDDKFQECFRKYQTVAESYADHSRFLKGTNRYKQLFTLDKTDYQNWAIGLKKAGYATDPNYAQRLIDIIDALNLHQYDCETTEDATAYTVADSSSTTPNNNTTTSHPIVIRHDASFVINPFHEHEVRYNNGVRYIEIVKGDTFEDIAIEFHTMVSELLKFNDLQPSANIQDLKYLYIRTKRNRAHKDCPTHTVSQGDSSWSIAHKYGIKLRKLRKYNSLASAEEPRVGDVLKLR